MLYHQYHLVLLLLPPPFINQMLSFAIRSASQTLLRGSARQLSTTPLPFVGTASSKLLLAVFGYTTATLGVASLVDRKGYNHLFKQLGHF